MTDAPLDPAALLATLAESGVDFVVIGALAVGVYSEVRATGDVDVMVPIGDEANKRALQQRQLPEGQAAQRDDHARRAAGLGCREKRSGADEARRRTHGRPAGRGQPDGLRWIRERLGEDLLDAVLVTTGKQGYRRKDGIAVVPAALLGP